MQRVRALAGALHLGVIYPRWFPDFSFGYGYPVLNFYAPGFYYPPALLTLLGMEPAGAVRAWLAVLYALSALGMFALLRLWVKPTAALLGVVIYLVFPYRLYDLFVRGALPEFAAFLWLPLIIYFTARAPRLGGTLVWASLCWAGLVLTHNLTALLAALTAAGLLPLLACFGMGKSHSPVAYARTLGRLGIIVLTPLALGALLSAWYWAPALLEARWVAIGAETGMGGYANHFAQWGSLFTWAAVYPYLNAAGPTVPLPGWLLLLVLGAALLAVALSAPASYKNRGMAPLLAGGLATAAVSIWLTTAAGGFVWQWGEPLLGKLQFPWRWQALLGTALALPAAASWQLLSDRMTTAIGRERGWRVRALSASLAALSIGWLLLYATWELPVAPAADGPDALTTAAMWAFDSRNGQVGASWTGEFLPTSVSEQRWAIGRAPSDGSTAADMPPVELTALPLAVGYNNTDYQVYTARPANLILHQFAYPAWHVLVDGQPAATQAAGSLGLLAVELAAGEHQVQISWGATTAVWTGRVLTAAGWLLFLLLLLRAASARRLRVQSRGRLWAYTAIVAWLLVGVLFLLGASGMTERTVQPAAVSADYGSVRLEAVDAAPTRPGQTAQVRLHWSIQGPVEPLVAFVHVVDAAGSVVAQHDGPLGGDYTPVERWLPGMALMNTHSIDLPAELPPGSYGLKVGLYRPGQAATPLSAAGTSDPRSDGGILTVQP